MAALRITVCLHPGDSQCRAAVVRRTAPATLCAPKLGPALWPQPWQAYAKHPGRRNALSKWHSLRRKEARNENVEQIRDKRGKGTVASGPPGPRKQPV